MKNLLKLWMLSSTLSFAHDVSNELNQSDIVIRHLTATTQILLYNPEIFLGDEGGKFYIDPQALIRSPNGDTFLSLDSQTSLPVTLSFEDMNGTFLISDPSIVFKAFIHVCNSCGHRWDGHVFTVKCPKCSSTDIKNIPNWQGI